ncbi:MAG TPA: hypothetical protein VFJ93_03665 [Gaiellaceae bacterium]|nr:hypothetical protein [Gaiellaceae bacterium]
MRRIAVAALLVAAFMTCGSARGGTGMFVGATEDNIKSIDPLTAKSKMDLAALAGLDTVRMSITWEPGQQRVGGDDAIILRNASAAAQIDGIRLMISIYPRDWRSAPLTSGERGQFAAFAASIAQQFPAIRDFIVGNEPNLNLFWMPQFGMNGVDLAARSYELLLARTYDALKLVSDDVNVIGGALASHGQDKPGTARPTHSPTAFIEDLGVAYRVTKRKRPIMDMFAIHPYLIPSKLPPTFAHPRTTTIGVADYPKLVKLLTTAFRGTAQRGETLPIVYDEFGYQSKIPKALRFVYDGLGTKAAADAIPEAQQAKYYGQAFALAACQPTVAGMLIFHVVDESDARAWQSGVYYANDRPKTSLRAVRSAALAAQSGTLARCGKAKTTSNVDDVVFGGPSAGESGMLETGFSCLTPCSYQLRVLDASTGEAVAAASGKAVGPATVRIPAAEIPAGQYAYALRTFKCGKPGTAETRFSTAFAVGSSDVKAALRLPTLEPVVP